MISTSRITLVLAILPVLFSAGCDRGAGIATEDPPQKTVADSVDPDLRRAAKAIETDPNDPNGYVDLARVYIKRARGSGDFTLNQKADEAIDKALAISVNDPSARKIKASLHLTFHRFEEAFALAVELQKEFPSDAFVYGILTDANVELGKYAEATKAAQSMVDLKPNSASYARVAHLRSLHGDSTGAIEMFRVAARTADPQDKEAQSWCLVQLGEEYWRNGRFEAAERVLDEAVANFPNYYLGLGSKAKVRASLGDLEAAERILNDLNARVPNVENVILLGDVLNKLGRAADAQLQYKLAEVIETRLGTSNDQKRIAILWADHDRNLEPALEIALRESAIRKDVFTLDALAWTLYKSGRLSEARDTAEKALNLKTGDARMIYHAAMIEKDLGNRPRARKLVELALKTNPAFDLLQADNARRVLDELK